jgi:MFS family permease
MPLASYLDYKFLIALRILQGIICSMAWPSMHVMSGKWIPKFERARFVSAYLGSSFGVSVFYPLFGFIMKITSWEYVFYFSAFIGFIWWICWQYFVYDTPGEHPRIHPIERNFIEESLSSTLKLNENNEEYETPWKKIFTSRALWINTIAQFAGIFGLYTILTQAPTYFKVIHGWESTKVGILSGVPHLLRTFMAILISHFADYLLRNEILSRNVVRKMGAALATVVNGIFVLCVAFTGCNSTLACIFIIIATGCHGAVSSGPLAAIIDISPK